MNQDFLVTMHYQGSNVPETPYRIPAPPPAIKLSMLEEKLSRYEGMSADPNYVAPFDLGTMRNEIAALRKQIEVPA